ncbi:MAG: hypothetical protein RLP09_18645 [Sandaracinaceae bacterium]
MADALAYSRRRRLEAQLSVHGERVESWLERRERADVLHQHRTQLRSIGNLLRGFLDGLRDDAEAVAGATTEDVYEACRTLEEDLAWLQRLWDYFRQRFDQRDDPDLQALLRAADDVAWSCYSPAVRRAEQMGLSTRDVCPLPFVEYFISPAATTGTWVPDDLAPRGSRLGQTLRQLPLAFVHLPAEAVISPHWLVFVAHEVGHCVQHELGLVEPFRQHVQTGLVAKGASPSEAEDWAGWSEEVFADAFAARLMPRSATRALVEFVRAPAAIMVRRRILHPPPLVRLTFLAALAKQNEDEASTQLAGLDLAALEAASPPETCRLCDLAHNLAEVVREPIGQGGVKLAALGSPAGWAEPQGRHIAAPRTLVERAMERWMGRVEQSPAASAETLAKDAEGLLRSLTTYRPEGERASGTESAQALGRALRDAVRADRQAGAGG